MLLSIRNRHVRDDNIQFFECGHKYIIKYDPNSKYTSVTTWNHSHFPHFDADKIIEGMMKSKKWKDGHKYWGLSADEIKKQWSDNGATASGAGTKMHYDIECFMNNDSKQSNYTHKDLLIPYDCTSNEWSYFLNFVKDTPHMKPYRTEWLVYNEDLKIAGSIDMVYENEDGTLSIYDWKRAKDITMVNAFNKYAVTDCISHMPDSNFWHYALQLNTYRAILEAKYDKKVRDMFLVRLHPDADEYELIQVPFLDKEIRELLALRT